MSSGKTHPPARHPSAGFSGSAGRTPHANRPYPASRQAQAPAGRAPAKPRMSREDMLAEWTRIREEVRERYRIDQVIQDLAGTNFVGSGSGTRRMACCPFHNERTPSFSVDTQKGVYICFGSGCGKQGDIFQFIQDFRGVTFSEALILAADNCGVSIPDELRNGRPVFRSAVRREPQSENALHLDPALLQPCDLMPVPSHFTRAVAGKSIWGWRHENGEKPAHPKRYFPPQMVHDYFSVDNAHLISILRIVKPDGTGKFFLPLRVEKLPDQAPAYLVDEHGLGWGYRGASTGHRRPIYGIHRTADWIAAGGSNILLVEGEKTTDATRRILSILEEQGWLIVSPMGGGNSGLYADWDGFSRKFASAGAQDVTLHIWPDADKIITRSDGTTVDPQVKFAAEIFAGFVSAMSRAGISADKLHGHRIKPPEGVEKGWDLADAESEGWTAAEVMSRINDHHVAMKIDERYLPASQRTPAQAPTPSAATSGTSAEAVKEPDAGRSSHEPQISNNPCWF